jgi:hypothetical protein
LLFTSVLFSISRFVLCSQSFLSKNKQQAVNEDSRDPVEEEYNELVDQDVAANVAIGEPDGALERLLVEVLPANFDHFTPRDGGDSAGCNVENFNLLAIPETAPKSDI